MQVGMLTRLGEGGGVSRGLTGMREDKKQGDGDKCWSHPEQWLGGRHCFGAYPACQRK